MIFNRKPKLQNKKNVSLQVDEFKGGVNTLYSETRLKANEAKEATNLMLDEDGVWKVRWGTKDYNSTGLFTETLDGIGEYKKSDGTRELIVVADGKVYVFDPAAGTKTEISGATFTQGTRAVMLQMSGYLYIANGTDNLARYDGSTLSTYSALTTPAWDGTPIARTGLSAGNYTYYYRVSAVNAIGESLAVAETSITTDKIRDGWDSSNYLTLGWADVSGATRYVIYFGETSGYLEKLAESSISSYVDDGTATPNPYIEPPTSNTSAGPLFRSMIISGNRLWATGDPSNLQRVYYTGTGVNLGNFAPGYGGGWIDLEAGGRDQCIAVRDYGATTTLNSTPHVFCKTDDGKGSIWKITMTSVEIGSTTISVPIPSKLISRSGTPAERSVVYVENDIYFLNPDGVFVLGYEPNILNVMRSNEISTKISPYIEDLYEPSIDKSSAFYYQGKVLFSVPTSSGEPNRIIVYDREYKAWMKDWTVGVSQFLTYTDSSDVTHLLGINGNKIIEFSEGYQGDQGTAFTWRYVSPRYQISKDWTEYAKIKRAYIRLRNANGSINYLVKGTKRNAVTSNLATGTITPGSSRTGIGWDKFGAVQFGSTLGVPSQFAAESLPRYLEIRDLVRDIQWELYGDGISDSAILTGILAEGNIVKVAKPEGWRLD